MTKFLSLLAASLAAVSAVAAQSFGEQVLSALRQNNLTALADVVQQNPSLVEALQSSGNKTVLAPTNQALQAAGQLPSANDLVRLITYHVLNGTWTNDRIDDDDNERIAASTLLTDGVRLPGNRSQVVILDREGDDDNERSFVIGTNSNVSFVSDNDGPALGSILVQPISGVLTIPRNLSTTLGNISDSSSLVSALQQANLVNALDNARGLTVFVPNNGAFQSAQQAIGGATPEQVVAVLSNHVINGTVVYSFQLEGDDDNDDGGARVRNATTASGQQLTFEEDDDEIYVRSGDIRARIVRSDVLTNNGVVHVIDQVLLNTATNQTAANEAADDAADNAQTAAPPGSTGTTGSGSGSGSGGRMDGAQQLASIGVAGLLAVVASAAFTLA